MLWRFFFLLAVGTFVVYRLSLARKIARARRTGDTAREQRLRRLAFGLMHWVIGGLALLSVLFTVLVMVNDR
jgi:hypothetical protein